MTLLDLMTVWDVDNEWREMEQLGLSILLAFAAQQDLDVSRKSVKYSTYNYESCNSLVVDQGSPKSVFEN